MQFRLLRQGALLVASMSLASCWLDGGSSSSSSSNDPPPGDQPPNILFVIMDDVGIDQMESFGYGGLDVAGPPAVPSIDALADNGIRFRNTWVMPECSPSRATFMTGLYPMRTNVLQAIGPDDLANSHVSPFVMTVPKVLAAAGYESGMFGKYHMGGPENNPAGIAAPAALGWEYFYGWGGLPAAIDPTAGGVAPEGVSYSCGFVPSAAQGGADFGACFIPQGGEQYSCTDMASDGHLDEPVGLQCLTQGGVLVPDGECGEGKPHYVDFELENAHYVSKLLINWEGDVEDVKLSDPRSRGYRATIEVDSAIDWINTRSDETPWMATLSFSSAHTPLQHAPRDLAPTAMAGRVVADCTSDALPNQRRVTDGLIESLDTELGRLLVETGIASRASDGSLSYDPNASNTVVVVVGDNGSFAPTVKANFDMERSKGSAYQTGVWVPLVISGPLVEQPNRNVEHMVNAVDLYQFFADVAGVDLDELVPGGTDAEEMLSYLTNPERDSVRELNFTHGALNIQAHDGVNGPCVFNKNYCSHTPMSQQICFDNGGVWWGPGAELGDEDGQPIKAVDHCWQVNQALFERHGSDYEQHEVTMAPKDYMAIRNDEYKLVINKGMIYDPDTDSGIPFDTKEFYRIDQAAPVPNLDREGDHLEERNRTAVEQENFEELEYQLELLLASHQACPGDGNSDGIVDQQDIDNYTRLTAEWSGSSTYDFNHDGVTDQADLAIIQANQGPCPQ